MENNYDAIIIGGGAAGMMAAVTAGRRGRSVLVIEAQSAPGKKLSVTGNGRCNITHDPISTDVYYTDYPKRLEKVLSAFDLTSTRMFFEGIGVAVYNKDGYVYPRSNEARSVVKCLTLALEEAKAEVLTGHRVSSVEKKADGFIVAASDGENEVTFHSKKVVIACGGLAGSEVGGCGDGFGLAQALGHRCNQLIPSLTDLYCEGLDFSKAKGTRVHGSLSVQWDGELISNDIGEIQFTERGISGIPVFNVSYESIMGFEAKKDVFISIDLFPELDEVMLSSYLKYRFSIGRRSVEECLMGLLPERLIPAILKIMDLNGTKAARISEERFARLVSLLKDIRLLVTGFGDYSKAQVTGGGVPLHDLSDELESDHIEGLYFVGETCDVNAICGGYNLQWAWSSGAVVGNVL